METQGIRRMLDDYNCRHKKTPVVVGVTPPRYSAEELAALEAAEKVKHEWNGREYTLYELTQVLRKYDRNISRITRQYEYYYKLYRETGGYEA